MRWRVATRPPISLDRERILAAQIIQAHVRRPRVIREANDIWHESVTGDDPVRIARKARVLPSGLKSDPVLADAPWGDGGRQGLAWEHGSLRRDEDGDVAHGFFVFD